MDGCGECAVLDEKTLLERERTTYRVDEQLGVWVAKKVVQHGGHEHQSQHHGMQPGNVRQNDVPSNDTNVPRACCCPKGRGPGQRFCTP